MHNLTAIRRKPGGFFLAAILLLLSACSTNHTSAYRRFPREYGCNAIDESELRARLLLIGDAGDPAREKKEPVLDLLEKWASESPKLTTIVYLGDNIYSTGLNAPRNSPQYLDALRRANALLQPSRKSGAGVVLIPGNHDWSRGREGLCRQANFFSRSGKRVTFAPKPCGCNGPQEIETPALRLIALDTTRLKDSPESIPEGQRCPAETKEQTYAELERLLSKEDPRPVVILGHHGLISYGSHGEYYEFDDHFFPLSRYRWLPLPGIGTAAVLYQKFIHCRLGGCSPMRRAYNELKPILQRHQPLAYAGAHDHSLQVLDGSDMAGILLVSGGGSAARINEVGDGRETIFSQSAAGFMALDYFSDRRTRVRVFVAARDAASNTLAPVYEACFMDPRVKQ